jgi:HEAT repeat protein
MELLVAGNGRSNMACIRSYHSKHLKAWASVPILLLFTQCALSQSVDAVDLSRSSRPLRDRLDQLVDMVADEEQYPSLTELGCFPIYNDEVIDALIVALRNPETSYDALTELSRRGALSHRAVPAILDCIAANDAANDTEENREAFYALGAIGPAAQPGLPRLVEELDRPDLSVHDLRNIIWAIGNIAPPDADIEARFREMLLSESISDETKRDVILALSQMGYGPETAALIESYFEDEESQLTGAAADALARNGEFDRVWSAYRQQLLEGDPRTQRWILMWLSDLGPIAQAAVDDVEEVFYSSDNVNVRPRAISTIADIGVLPSDGLIDDLFAMLGDPEEIRGIHGDARRALGVLMDQDASILYRVTEMLTDDDPMVRVTGIRIFEYGSNAARRATARIVELLSGDDVSVRYYAALALPHLGPVPEPILGELGDAIDNETIDEVRLRMIVALEQCLWVNETGMRPFNWAD